MAAFTLSYFLQCEVSYNAAKKIVRDRESADSQDCCDYLSRCQAMDCFQSRTILPEPHASFPLGELLALRYVG